MKQNAFLFVWIIFFSLFFLSCDPKAHSFHAPLVVLKPLWEEALEQLDPRDVPKMTFDQKKGFGMKIGGLKKVFLKDFDFIEKSFIQIQNVSFLKKSILKYVSATGQIFSVRSYIWNRLKNIEYKLPEKKLVQNPWIFQDPQMVFLQIFRIVLKTSLAFYEGWVWEGGRFFCQQGAHAFCTINSYMKTDFLKNLEHLHLSASMEVLLKGMELFWKKNIWIHRLGKGPSRNDSRLVWTWMRRKKIQIFSYLFLSSLFPPKKVSWFPIVSEDFVSQAKSEVDFERFFSRTLKGLAHLRARFGKEVFLETKGKETPNSFLEYFELLMNQKTFPDLHLFFEMQVRVLSEKNRLLVLKERLLENMRSPSWIAKSQALFHWRVVFEELAFVSSLLFKKIFYAYNCQLRRVLFFDIKKKWKQFQRRFPRLWVLQQKDLSKVESIFLDNSYLDIRKEIKKTLRFKRFPNRLLAQKRWFMLLKWISFYQRILIQNQKEMIRFQKKGYSDLFLNTSFPKESLSFLKLRVLRNFNPVCGFSVRASR